MSREAEQRSREAEQRAGDGTEREREREREPEPEREASRDRRRVVIDPGGPVLVEGPVEVDLGDGRTAASDRFVVALCACRRSRNYPWCDTSHRRHTRPDSPAGEHSAGERGSPSDSPS